MAQSSMALSGIERSLPIRTHAKDTGSRAVQSCQCTRKWAEVPPSFCAVSLGSFWSTSSLSQSDLALQSSEARQRHLRPPSALGGQARGSARVSAQAGPPPDPPAPSGLSRFFGRVQASLPVVGLLKRLTSDEGGVGADRLHYSEFCVRNQRRMSPEISEALLEFQARYGQMARPKVVMFWCWLASVGAGVVREEEVILSARRMRASLDMEYELNLIDTLLDDPANRVLAVRVSSALSQDAKAAVAAEAIAECCVGRATVVDQALLLRILQYFFPGASLELPEQDNLQAQDG